MSTTQSAKAMEKMQEFSECVKPLDRKKTRPLIGVTPSSVDSINRKYTVNADYMNAIWNAGGVPVLLPLLPEKEQGALLDKIDGLLLTGGADVGPDTYKEKPKVYCGETSPERDAFEMPLCRAAVKRDLPVLGICRGHQVLNVSMGGSLLQDVEMELHNETHVFIDHPQYTRGFEFIHAMTLTDGDNLLERVFIDEKAFFDKRFMVNSSHHQGINRLAPGMTVDAHADDGLIESIHLPGKRFALGVQWHPERLTAISPEASAIFSAFVRASAAK